ncbi:MAG: hypothetical protein OSA99_18255 [Acidimicrobiales bacterium]|nr:hypothetical protein [Acidimicrobiales bacterium]
MSTIDQLRLLVEIQLQTLGVRTRDDRGAVSTEMAVAIAVFVAIAAAAGVIFMAKATSNANNIPDTVVPPAAP